ncbi:MAG: hypothetical protein CMLOHMNK_01344 [Steroidobacteraceae bacterium]|nr:hypothetical protein [Steroidobacteraceae bacterium]
MRAALALILWLAAPAWGAGSCMAIIGTGEVGGALGMRFAGLGHAIVYGSRTPQVDRVRELVARTGGDARALIPQDAAQACGILVLAIPWEAAESTVAGLGDLDGKIVIDVTNPIRVRDGRVQDPGLPASGVELLQSRAPRARFVKAFNTVNYRIMANPKAAGGPVSVPLSSDDAAAKAEVAKLVSALGLEPADVGPLDTARYTERMAMLYVDMLVRGGPAYEFYFRPRR